MAKYPDPGRVKTRLSPPLPKENAAQLYLAFLLDTLDLVSNISSTKYLAYYPTTRKSREFFAQISQGRFKLLPQKGKNLGEKVSSVLDTVAPNSQNPTVIIGTDSPFLPPNYLEKAFEFLTKTDLVLGPSLDGGYYLIGLKKIIQELFEDIEWSTNLVLKQTLAKAKKINLTVAMLPYWFDIDRPSDFKQLRFCPSSTITRAKRSLKLAKNFLNLSL
jgi:hypothetical protein